MRDTDQTIIKFDYDKNLKNIFYLLNIRPKLEKNFVNVIGEKLS